MKNIELKIDGEVIVLTSHQTEQLRKAIVKETSVAPMPKTCGNITLSCKPNESTYPFVISSAGIVPVSWGVNTDSKGRDFSLWELKGFIRDIKAYATQVWDYAEKDLKNV